MNPIENLKKNADNMMQTREVSEAALKEAGMLLNDGELDLVSGGAPDIFNLIPKTGNAESGGTGLQSTPRPGR